MSNMKCNVDLNKVDDSVLHVFEYIVDCRILCLTFGPSVYRICQKAEQDRFKGQTAFRARSDQFSMKVFEILQPRRDKVFIVLIQST
jgi:hypothetical protein